MIDKFPIGQMFRKLEKLPNFELLDVDFGDSEGTNDGADQLWRKYRLHVDGFETEILEVFPSREMFQRGDDWLVSPLPPPTMTFHPLSWYLIALMVLVLSLNSLVNVFY